MTDETTAQVRELIEQIEQGHTALGVEFGSTRIKAVLIDRNYHVLAQGDHARENHLDNGLWTYSLDEVWSGVQDAYARLARAVQDTYGVTLKRIERMGFSAMMHGYLAFDASGGGAPRTVPHVEKYKYA